MTKSDDCELREGGIENCPASVKKGLEKGSRRDERCLQRSTREMLKH